MVAAHIQAAADEAALRIPGTASVADQAAFRALPAGIQALARKVLLLGDDTSESALARAYRAGFEDCSEEVDIQRPFCSEAEALTAVRELTKTGGAA